MLQLFHLDIAKVDQGILHMLQVFQRHVASVCSKYFIYFQAYVVIVFYLNVAYVDTISFQMFQSYVAASGFHVVSCKCFIWMFCIFHTYVASACSKYFICFETYVAFKCFFHVISVLCCWAGSEPGAGGWGCCSRGCAGCVLVLSRSSRLPSSARTERVRGGFRGRTTGAETKAECARGAERRWTKAHVRTSGR